jgi:hypothetical protein
MVVVCVHSQDMRPRSLSLLACLLAAVVAVVGVVAWACADVTEVGGRLTWTPRFHVHALGVQVADVTDTAQGAGAKGAGFKGAGPTGAPMSATGPTGQITAAAPLKPARVPSIGVAHDEATAPGPLICGVVPLRHAATNAAGRRLLVPRWTLARRLPSNQLLPVARIGPAPALRQAGRGPRRRRPHARTRSSAAGRSSRAGHPHQITEPDLPNQTPPAPSVPRALPWSRPVLVHAARRCHTRLAAGQTPDAEPKPHAETVTQ